MAESHEYVYKSKSKLLTIKETHDLLIQLCWLVRWDQGSQTFYKDTTRMSSHECHPRSAQNF